MLNKKFLFARAGIAKIYHFFIIKILVQIIFYIRAARATYHNVKRK